MVHSDASVSVPGEREGLIVAPFEVSVTGFPGYTYFAASRGKALAKAWDSYRSFGDCTFGEFLRMARARKTEPTGRFGEPIKVSGREAFYISHNGQYVQFVLPGEDVVLNSHPMDVSRAANSIPAPLPGTDEQSEGVDQ
jgi:hypothetical protein